MNKNINSKKIIIAILAIFILITVVGNTVKAVINTVVDETKKVSLTITKYEHSNGNKENIELKGVEFTVSLIPNDIEQVEKAIEYARNNNATSYKKVTPDNGTIKFEDLEQGRYLVEETDAPKNVVSKIESFLIDLPRTNENGNGLDYDVTVYPKNITIYGTVKLNQRTQDGEPLQGGIWELQKEYEDGLWETYDCEKNLISDENGNIEIQNLEVGKYKLVEMEAIEGYILDQTKTIEFEINNENINYEFTSTNENVKIQKQILQDNGEYGKNKGAFKKDTNSWKITANVADVIGKMDVYMITDELPDGLTYKDNSVKIYGLNNDDEQIEMDKSCYRKNIKENMLQIEFDTKQLEKYKNIIIKYDTNFSDDVSYGEFINKVYLTYTNHINEDCIGESEYTISSEAEVHTGAVLIYKTDEKNNPLEGASFKIANSKEEANAGVFIKDKNGEDIVASSDKNGYVIFDGLKYDSETSYWIVEVQAPSYEEDGETKYYKLQKKSIKVVVDSNSQDYSEKDTIVVVNKKNFVLPMTGGTLSIISSVLGLGIIISVILIKRKK